MPNLFYFVAALSLAIIVLSYAVIRLTRRVRWLEANVDEKIPFDFAAVTQSDMTKMMEIARTATFDARVNPDA